MDRKKNDNRGGKRGPGKSHAGRPFRGKPLRSKLPRPRLSAATEPAAKAGERIAKVIARAGLGSRREAEEWIAAGRVMVNGDLINSPARNVSPADTITLDGKPLPARERTRLFLYHKPAGLVTTTSDPQGRGTIFAELPEGLPRLISIGRLDLNTEGLLLLTNDGGLARVLELPQTGWLRRYRVRAHGRITQGQLDGLRTGIDVDGVQYGPIEATLDREQGANIWLTFAMREGKNREVRNVLGHLGLQVNRLIRVSYGPFQLGELAEGQVEEVRTRMLRDQLGERIAALAHTDFSAPIIARETPEPPSARPQTVSPTGRAGQPRRADTPIRDRERPKRTPGQREGFRTGRDGDRPRQKLGPQRNRRDFGDRPSERDAAQKPRDKHAGPRTGHVWRERKEIAPGGDAPPKRKRWERQHPKFAGEAARQEDRPRKMRAGLLTDRKGRRILVQRTRSEQPPAPEEPARAKRDVTHRDRAGNKRPPRKPRDFSRQDPPRGKGPPRKPRDRR